MKKKTYEESILRLEEIVNALENGSLPIEDALKLFEEGTHLSAFCTAYLKGAEQRVEELSTYSEEQENDC